MFIEIYHKGELYHRQELLEPVYATGSWEDRTKSRIEICEMIINDYIDNKVTKEVKAMGHLEYAVVFESSNEDGEDVPKVVPKIKRKNKSDRKRYFKEPAVLPDVKLVITRPAAKYSNDRPYEQLIDK